MEQFDWYLYIKYFIIKKRYTLPRAWQVYICYNYLFLEVDWGRFKLFFHSHSAVLELCHSTSFLCWRGVIYLVRHYLGL